RGRVRGPDRDRGPGVVPEDDVGGGVAEGRLDADRVAVDVDGVRPMGDVLVGAPEDRVVDGGGELTDASAHAHGHLSTGDDRCGQIALGSGAATDHRVQVEYLAREYDVPVECPGQTLDVLHPILTAGVVGRVPRHQVHTG